ASVASGSSTDSGAARWSRGEIATSNAVSGAVALSQYRPRLVGTVSSVPHGRMRGCSTSPVRLRPASSSCRSIQAIASRRHASPAHPSIPSRWASVTVAHPDLLARLPDDQPGCYGSELRQLVVWVGERAGIEREAAAADTGRQLVPQAHELLDAAVEIRAPRLREPLPVIATRGATVREGVQRGLDLGERDAHPLGRPDERHAAQRLALVATLVARRAPALDQSLTLVEVQRGDRDAAALGELLGCQLAAQRTRMCLVGMLAIRHGHPPFRWTGGRTGA